MINWQVLGKPGKDNAVYVQVDSGQSTYRFLFDCGYGCLDELAVAEIKSLDALFMSHFHMDHIGGFDSLFRFNFDRPASSPLQLFGPFESVRIFQQRMQAFTWNLVSNSDGVVVACEFASQTLRRVTLPTRFGFQIAAKDELQSCSGVVFETPEVSITAIELDHGCISMGYIIREANRINISSSAMRDLGLRPGPWIRQIKDVDAVADDAKVDVCGTLRIAGELRTQLLTRQRGSSLAYLTDFRPRQSELEQLAERIRGVDTLICENSYSNADLNLAIQNRHLCSQEVGALAAAAQVMRLIPFHLSERYDRVGWRLQLEEVRAVFPRTDWPDTWRAQIEMDV